MRNRSRQLHVLYLEWERSRQAAACSGGARIVPEPVVGQCFELMLDPGPESILPGTAAELVRDEERQLLGQHRLAHVEPRPVVAW